MNPSVSAIKVTPSKRFIPASLNGDHLSSVQRNSGCTAPCMRRQGNGIAKSLEESLFPPRWSRPSLVSPSSNVYAATGMPELVCLDLSAEGVGMKPLKPVITYPGHTSSGSTKARKISMN